jgi:hypothetical protein
VETDGEKVIKNINNFNMSVRKCRIACQKLMQKQKQKSSVYVLIFNYTVVVVGIPFEAFSTDFAFAFMHLKDISAHF